MALAQKLNLRQSQSLVMTPQLTQSIQMLALSNVEIQALVDAELEKNPFLEEQSEPHQRENAPDTDAEASQDPQEVSGKEDLAVSAQSLADELGTSLENQFPDEQDYRNRTEQPKSDMDRNSGGLTIARDTTCDDFDVVDRMARPTSLRDHLNGQLAVSGAHAHLTVLVRDMIENLDQSGYWRGEIAATAVRLGTEESVVAEALALLQSMDPPGIGARTLAECLSLQLRELDRLDPAMQTILDNLELLAKRDFAGLSQLSGLQLDDLHDAFVEITKLDPKPGTRFDHDPLINIQPDVIVSEAQDGSWTVELNDETLPRLLVNETYVHSVQRNDNAGTKTFVEDCLRDANWLTRSLDQRAKTILKVASEIVRHQDAFLINGVAAMKPLTMQEVADAIDMHESTVSRVANNKFMLTPRGVFELKFFFSRALAGTDGGDAHSAEAVRARIKQMIDDETADGVLSDDAIVASLSQTGVDIARRTVAKYRDAMHIPSSVQRRRLKRAALAASQAGSISRSVAQY